MGTPLLWLAFNVFVLGAVALDLGFVGRRLHKIGLREAALSSVAWVALSVLFGLGILHYSGHQQALEFFTGYLIEKALSVDNLFLFLVIFRTFAIDDRFQHRMLEWGILGALIMRGAMIAAGAELIERFSWIMYLFGAFLLYAGIHMLFAKKEKIHPNKIPSSALPIAICASRGSTMASIFSFGSRGGCSPRRCFWCCWWWRSPT